MRALTRFLATCSLIFSLSCCPTLALPQPVTTDSSVGECPEVIPAPGLPSLASLNLTSADLCKPPEEFMKTYTNPASASLLDTPLSLDLPPIATTSANEGESSLVKRYEPRCSTSAMNPEYAWGCFNYLHALGSTPCVINSTTYMIRFCYTDGPAGSVEWWGMNMKVHLGMTVQSTCRNVALGGHWVLYNCVIDGALRDGANAAWGNEDIVVILVPA
ncbi:hypothetical protein CC1G_09996 [Coprinopsis cinerea okayama7|uniref:Uncharacterized protein n=1 Tax=Coprinopsis cinerea (strain Okayama-7 / 130 / ATCC MYA-4618 / FGSC 9003) TaxID=240176 RepID=A8NDI7_COPC7|nr:hypothetical protein CC1G_09996 [Coprinopsis cinerea okayama7\|eukprot:XP_001832782.2 hypothetical protein CC1G_09996 [Coprinopsis cinerea okayama7\